MIKSFKVEILPTAKQREYLHKAFGIRRYAWNWAMTTYFATIEVEGKHLGAYELAKKFRKDVVKDTPWLKEVNEMFMAESFKDFGLAIKSWYSYQKTSKKKSTQVSANSGKPRFKKKGKCVDSARMNKKTKSHFKVCSAHLFTCTTTRDLGRMKVKTTESIEFLKNADIKTCTFSRQAGKYFMSLVYEKTNPKSRTHGTGRVGIDLGIKHAATCYDGNEFTVHDVSVNLSKAEKKTEHVNKLFARTKKGSKRHEKMKLRLQRAYAREVNIKKDWREKFTTHLVENYDTIVIDDFSFGGAKNLDVNRALYRVSPYAFKVALERKVQERGAKVVYVPTGTPTTKTCSKCGQQHAVSLSTRTYRCDCGLVIDRDQNAAINVYNYC